MFKVHVGYTRAGRDRWVRFVTLAQAMVFCEEVRRPTGIVLTVIAG